MKNTLIAFVILFVLAVGSRLTSHLWNFTLVGGVLLFAGHYFQDKKIAVALMFAVMLASDAVIGFHSQMPSVYLAYLIVVGLGFLIGSEAKRLKVLGLSFAGSFLFYAITNFAVWYGGVLYPMTLQGLIDCYVMALPFYRNQLVSDLMTSFALFEVMRYMGVYATQKAKA